MDDAFCGVLDFEGVSQCLGSGQEMSSIVQGLS
jgi:hypothetical protein